MSTSDQITKKARLIAFYLPQFHPIPENDEWWGKGFTEWTNVVKAKPLYRGHHQPNLPADLGFYDLRVPEVREAQAQLAREHGIEGFCYWHYWFGNGKQLLERPLQEVVKTGKPDFPFCLAWANHSWGGVWNMTPGMIQTYPGINDYINHFNTILPILKDTRYIKFKDKPIIVIYRPGGIPDPVEFTDLWRALAQKEGLNGIYFIGIEQLDWKPESHGFDSLLPDVPNVYYTRLPYPYLNRTIFKFLKRIFKFMKKKLFHQPDIYSYSNFIKTALSLRPDHNSFFPCIVPNWDNAPRAGLKAVVLKDNTPQLFQEYLESEIKAVSDRPWDEKIIFIKSWNEWAEGNYLEPDLRFGRKYLEICRKEVFGEPS